MYRNLMPSGIGGYIGSSDKLSKKAVRHEWPKLQRPNVEFRFLDLWGGHGICFPMRSKAGDILIAL